MQTIYEHDISHSYSAHIAKKNLIRSFDDMYMLYIRILSMFSVLACMAEQIIEIKKQKYFPTETDLQPNLKFIENEFIKKIAQNTSLQRYVRENNLEWNNETDLMFIRKIYDVMSNADFFIEYMQNSNSSFEKGKELVLSIIEKFMLENEDIIHYFGEVKISWLHDFNDVIILVHNTLKSFTEIQSDDRLLPTLFKFTKDGISEEWNFAQDLLTKTIQNNEKYVEIVANKLRNWELERIARIDFIIIKMAICEFCEFPSIPLRVTFDEYIEIAKYYSTPKSRNFINGLLDTILFYLKQENKINKRGRGLMG
jgi:N utilization substance protein B